MSVLGREEIIAHVKARKLTISPILFSKQIGAASVDVRMGNVVLVVRSRGASHVDPSLAKEMQKKGVQHDIALGRQQKHERYEVPFLERFLLHPGSLALVPTLEWIRIPADLRGYVTARSTWAREGLSIATATLIEPRYEGIVTLELANLGEIPIALFPGMSLAQIAFERVIGETTTKKESQFQLSFEPSQGTIAPENDLVFIPDRKD